MTWHMAADEKQRTGHSYPYPNTRAGPAMHKGSATEAVRGSPIENVRKGQVGQDAVGRLEVDVVPL
jgi:hypothetical protein